MCSIQDAEKTLYVQCYSFQNNKVFHFKYGMHASSSPKSNFITLPIFRVGLDTHAPTHPLTPKSYYKQYTIRSTVGCLSNGFFPSNKFRWNRVRKLLHLIGPTASPGFDQDHQPSRDSSTTSRPQNYIFTPHNTKPRRNAGFL